MKILKCAWLWSIAVVPLSLTGEEVKTNTGDCCGPVPPSAATTPWTIQIRGAAFLPLKEQLRDIYGTAWPTMELESSYQLMGGLWQDSDQLLLWENVSWATKTGSTIGFGYYTNLNLVPFSVGLEYQVHVVAGLDFYIGLGPAWSLLWIKNYDGFETTHLKRNGWGLVAKSGFRYTFCKHFFVDVYGDYDYTHFREMDHDPIQRIENNFSAFLVGGGVGVKF